MRTIKKVIIHCSATKPSMDIGAETIRRWHVDGNNWADIGYHFVVRLDGAIEKGRDIDVVGAHCKGQNASSIGICYAGGVDENGQPEDTRTSQQKAALIELTSSLSTLFPGVTFHGHKEYSPKACPSFNVEDEGYGTIGSKSRCDCCC